MGRKYPTTHMTDERSISPDPYPWGRIGTWLTLSRFNKMMASCLIVASYLVGK
jgi:hypothetical protein